MGDHYGKMQRNQSRVRLWIPFFRATEVGSLLRQQRAVESSEVALVGCPQPIERFFAQI
jgi:hypothetical protein